MCRCFRGFLVRRIFAGPRASSRDDLCSAYLVFPFAHGRLEQANFRKSKLVDCFPVVNYQRFYDVRPNGDAIMNVGACIRKKKMEDFVELAILAPTQELIVRAWIQHG